MKISSATGGRIWHSTYNLKVRKPKKFKIMYTIKSFFYPFIKFFKGIFAIIALNFLIVMFFFILNSCRKSDFENSLNGKANAKFRSALALNSKSIASISFDTENEKNHEKVSRVSSPATNSTIYVQFPNEVTPEIETSFYSTNSIQGLSDLVQYKDAIIQDEPTVSNINYSIDVPVEEVIQSLSPLVVEAKQYLYSKGFTESAIQSMITENNGTEQDLVAFVMTLTNIENNQNTLAKNNLNLFVNQTFALNEYVKCALVAIGADVLWALGSSSAATWSVAMMTRAFSAVAKRFLGPIGVAIAVVSFGVCLATWLNVNIMNVLYFLMIPLFSLVVYKRINFIIIDFKEKNYQKLSIDMFFFVIIIAVIIFIVWII